MNPPALNQPVARRGIWLVTMEPAASRAIAIVYRLREQGALIQYDLLARSFKAQFKQADRNNCRWALIIGPDDLEKGQAVLRDMELGEQQELSLETLEQHVLNLEGVR